MLLYFHCICTLDYGLNTSTVFSECVSTTENILLRLVCGPTQVIKVDRLNVTQLTSCSSTASKIHRHNYKQFATFA